MVILLVRSSVVSMAGLMVILIDCGFDGGIILILMDSVVRVPTMGLMLILIGSVVRGFDGEVDGDVDRSGRPWFRRRDWWRY